LAKDLQGTVWTWGTNKHGELGFGDREPRPEPCPVSMLQGKKVT